jgi:membrane-associated phospholipid phosphatase
VAESPGNPSYPLGVVRKTSSGAAGALLPGWARRPAAWLLAGCVALTAVLGALVAGETRADPFDQPIDSAVIRLLGRHHHLMLDLTFPGTRTGAFLLTALVVIGCLLARRYDGAVLVASSMIVAIGLDDYVLKPFVHRTYYGSLVYPSGHSTATITLAAVLTVLLAPVATGSSAFASVRRWRWLAAAVLVVAWLAVVLVVLAVIALRWHYFTDTVAGAAVGIGTVCALTLAIDRLRGHP